MNAAYERYEIETEPFEDQYQEQNLPLLEDCASREQKKGRNLSRTPETDGFKRTDLVAFEHTLTHRRLPPTQ